MRVDSKQHREWFMTRGMECIYQRSIGRRAVAVVWMPVELDSDRGKSQRNSTRNRRSMTAWIQTATLSVENLMPQVERNRPIASTTRDLLTLAVSNLGFFKWIFWLFADLFMLDRPSFSPGPRKERLALLQRAPVHHSKLVYFCYIIRKW